MATTSSAQQLTSQANVLLPGLYAWVATVVSPAFARDSGWAPKVTAGVALLALVVGPFAAPVWPRVGRAVGVHGFVGAAVLTWALAGQALALDRLEPIQACLGGLGWAFFAFGWGRVRDVGSVPEDDPNVVEGTPLQARGALPTGGLVVFGVGLLGALAPLVAAWRVARPQHAVFAHAVAALAAVALISAGVEVAVARTDELHERTPGQRLGSASRSLGLVGLALVVGLLWRLLQ